MAARKCRFCHRANAVEPCLFEPRSPLPGNEFLKAETNSTKELRRFKKGAAETESAKQRGLFGGYSARPGKSPLDRECVVGLEGFEPANKRL